MSHESLSDKAISTVAAIIEVHDVLRGTNDYGDSTGYCSDLDQLQNDALNQLGALRARAYALKRRFSLEQAEKQRAAGVGAA